MRIFITGGTGNIGQYVTKALSERGHELTVYTRTPERIPAMSKLAGVTLVGGNILDIDKMKKNLAGCDAVIHIALGWGNEPITMLENDTKVTVSLAEYAEKAGVKNFIYTSSTAVNGSITSVVNEETMRTPADIYGATKGASELFLLGFKQYYTAQGAWSDTKVRMRRNIVRPGYTFSNPAWEGGASQSDTRFRSIAQKVLKNEDIELSANDGTQFISSQQIAQLYVKLVESDLNEQIFYALGSVFTSWADIAKMALKFVPESTSKIVTPKDEAPRNEIGYSVEKMKRVFGLSFDATEDLREHVRWNIERERAALEGKTIYNTKHEFSD